jgi:hypothetical protein
MVRSGTEHIPGKKACKDYIEPEETGDMGWVPGGPVRSQWRAEAHIAMPARRSD